VSERLEGTAPGVWAVGDICGGTKSPISVERFRIVGDNLNGGNHVTTGRQVPSCLFPDPEFARVGLSEREDRAQGCLRALSETRGFLKALVEKDGDGILGFAASGADAGEILPAVQIAIIAELPAVFVRDCDTEISRDEWLITPGRRKASAAIQCRYRLDP